MKKAILYIHGKGGSYLEAEQYKEICIGYDVIGIDYNEYLPWIVENQIKSVYENLRNDYEHISIIANSIGAYFSMYALQNYDIEKAFFISPILDMEKLILDMMVWANVTEKELLEKEEALRVLEEELKKREAELGAQSDNPPSKPKKRPNPLNSEARKLFEERYQALFSSNYYWSAKDAGNMSSLLKKLKFQREKKNLPIDDQGVLNALKYLLDSITDGWILENFSVTNINSKFNEIVSQIMARKQEHGNTKHTDGAKAREQQTDREIMEYARSAFRKDVFGDS